MKDLKNLVRPNVWNMKPYSSARDEFQGNASVFLDANENPFNRPYNRYPDPLQWELKKKIAEIKGVKRESIFLGNGSDEPIDLIIRAFCEPSIDSVVSIDPSYGMYEVAANVNNVEFRKIKLDEKFDLDTDSLLEAADDWVKVIFLCSPNNPTGNNLSRDRLYKVLNTFQGIVVIDEAYVDFSIEPSFLGELDKFPNLIVLQTMSKAWGAAGIRLGMAFDQISVQCKSADSGTCLVYARKQGTDGKPTSFDPLRTDSFADRITGVELRAQDLSYGCKLYPGRCDKRRYGL